MKLLTRKMIGGEHEMFELIFGRFCNLANSDLAG